MTTARTKKSLLEEFAARLFDDGGYHFKRTAVS